MTLLEVILAISLVTILAAGIYSFHDFIVRSRGEVRRAQQRLFAHQRALDVLGDEIAAAVDYGMLMTAQRSTGLTGEAESISFACTAVPSRAVFWAPKLINTPGAAEALESWEPESDIRAVTYRLRRSEDEEGVEHVDGLERTTLRTLLVVTEEEGRTVESTLVTEHVKFLYFRYWDGTAWTESWSGGPMPAAVRIDIGSEPLPEEVAAAEYPYETSWRIVGIPTAAASAGAGGGGGSARDSGTGEMEAPP